MLAALATSTLFLVSYLAYHFEVGSVRFTGPGPDPRASYFAILAQPHGAGRGDRARSSWSRSRARCAAASRRTARSRATPCPLWLWVSVSGVVVYWMLYRL